MRLDDRFDDLVTSLGGFYRAWVIQLGLELGLFTALRAAGPRGLAPAELAAATATAPDPIATWCRAAYACDLVDDDGERLHVDEVTASILLDADRPEYLGGQFAYTVTASLDYADMAQLLRTGSHGRGPPAPLLPLDRAADPAGHRRLLRGGAGRHPGPGRRCSPAAPTSSTSTAAAAAGSWPSRADSRRPGWSASSPSPIRRPGRCASSRRPAWSPGSTSRRARWPRSPIARAFDLAYFQHALHELADPAAALEAAWRALRPGGRLLVLGWCLPSSLDDLATLHGQLITGVALDEALHGGRLRTVEEHALLFAAAGLPAPQAIALPSDAVLLVVQRPS